MSWTTAPQYRHSHNCLGSPVLVGHQNPVLVYCDSGMIDTILRRAIRPAIDWYERNVLCLINIEHRHVLKQRVGQMLHLGQRRSAFVGIAPDGFLHLVAAGAIPLGWLSIRLHRLGPYRAHGVPPLDAALGFLSLVARVTPTRLPDITVSVVAEEGHSLHFLHRRNVPELTAGLPHSCSSGPMIRLHSPRYSSVQRT
jgi:hypothetical protein